MAIDPGLQDAFDKVDGIRASIARARREQAAFRETNTNALTEFGKEVGQLLASGDWGDPLSKGKLAEVSTPPDIPGAFSAVVVRVIDRWFRFIVRDDGYLALLVPGPVDSNGSDTWIGHRPELKNITMTQIQGGFMTTLIFEGSTGKAFRDVATRTWLITQLDEAGQSAAAAHEALQQKLRGG